MTLIVADLHLKQIHADMSVSVGSDRWAMASKVCVSSAGVFAAAGDWADCQHALASLRSMGKKVLDSHGKLRGTWPEGNWEVFAFLDAPYSQGAPYLIMDKGAAPLCPNNSPRYVAIGSAWQYARGFLDGLSCFSNESDFIHALFASASQAVPNVSREYQTVQYRPDGKSGDVTW